MKIILVLLQILLLSCSNINHEMNHSEQRRHAQLESHYVAWPKAKAVMLKKCHEIINIYQGHSRVVSVLFKDETVLTSISPKIDQVLDVIDECSNHYEEIEIIME